MSDSLRHDQRHAPEYVYEVREGDERNKALSDLYDSFLTTRLPYLLAWQDILQRYRRSTIGPFWLTINTAVFIAGFALVGRALFNTDLNTYLPYLTLGMIYWVFISTIMIEGSTVFVDNGHIIKQVRLPLLIQIIRLVLRNLIVMAHNFLVFVVVAFVTGTVPTLQVLLLLPALLVLAASASGVALFLGVLGARFKDVALIVTNAVQLLFFVTPIMWPVDMVFARGHGYLVEWNPIYHFLLTLRGPLLGTSIPASTWLIVALFGCAACAAGMFLFVRYRRRIAFWI